MLSLNPNHQRLPLGGWKFVESGQEFEADTFPELLKMVEIHRLANMIPFGNPDQDILQSFATDAPWVVIQDDRPIPEVSQAYSLWRDWVYSTWRKPPTRMITPEEAEDRWEKCELCKYNHDRPLMKSAESKEIAKRASILKAAQATPSHLGYCPLHKVDLSVFSLISNPQPYSKMDKDQVQPECCWVGCSLTG